MRENAPAFPISVSADVHFKATALAKPSAFARLLGDVIGRVALAILEPRACRKGDRAPVIAFEHGPKLASVVGRRHSAKGKRHSDGSPAEGLVSYCPCFSGPLDGCAWQREHMTPRFIVPRRARTSLSRRKRTKPIHRGFDES
jgi:hypothetical protein